MADNSTPAQKRYWLITSPRTASNLLVKILNLDEQGVRPAWNGGYFWMPSGELRMKLAQKPLSKWTEEELAADEKINQECFDALQDHLDASAAENQIVFVKEHGMLLWHPHYSNLLDFVSETKPDPAPSKTRGVDKDTRSALNETTVSDEFLKTWHPTFLIRHPAMMLPSLYRASLDDFGFPDLERDSKDPMASQLTLKVNRDLYDFYSEHFRDTADAHWPLVLDADDVMKKPELVAKYAATAGLDPAKLQFSWERRKSGEVDAKEKRMLSSLNSSSGIDLSKVAGDNIDIAAEGVKWRAEFGPEGGAKLEQWVRDAMPDYEYLRSKRLTLDN